MNPVRIEQLRSTFRETQPKLAQFFDRARTQREVEELQQLFLIQARERLAKALGKTVEQLDGTDQTATFTLKPDDAAALLSATGDTIEALVHKYLDGLQRLQNMTDDDAYQVAAQVLFMGAVAIGTTAITASFSTIIQGGTLAAAALLGVSTATVGAVCAIAAIVVLVVVIPIIYYMEKPALCMVLLINQIIDKNLTGAFDLDFKDDHNDHGKPVLLTTPINGGIDFGGGEVILGAGFVATSKRDNALRGTQYGFTYTVKSGSPNLSFGVEDPLIFGSNSGYCSIGSDSQSAADAVDSKGNLDYSAQSDGYNVRIRCNSGSGDIAYYVAAVSKT